MNQSKTLPNQSEGLYLLSSIESKQEKRDTNTSDEMWDSFWALYPRHVAKLAAKKAWAKVAPSQHVAILEALVSWRPVWRDKDPEYLPHPATWLNGERWEDELPQGFRRVTAESPQTASERARSVPEPEIRSAIPAHVLSVLARLKARL